MLSKLSFGDLMGSAAMVGFVGAGLSLYLMTRKGTEVTKQDYYVKAFKLLEQNRSAMDLIGKPIHKYRPNLSDNQNNCFENLSTRLKVPIKGRNRSGDMYVWADRPDTQNEWTVRRLELILNDFKDKKVVVYKNESND